jgi:hypothetical protein
LREHLHQRIEAIRKGILRRLKRAWRRGDRREANDLRRAAGILLEILVVLEGPA